VKLRGKRSKTTMGSIIELVVIVAVALGLALAIQAWVVKPYRIPSGSMEPTLAIGQRVLVNRIGMHFSKPHVGEIAVFHPPQGAQQQGCGQKVRAAGAACDESNAKEDSGTNFIKRIVAGPGDTIRIVEGHVFRNGKREADSYTRPCGVTENGFDRAKAEGSECTLPVAIKIPPGHWFMMGDNRGESDDSRFWGPVPTGWIVGGAFATYWPPDRIGIL
jgi:signal peptidase I